MDKKRMKALEQNFSEWFKHYFPDYTVADVKAVNGRLTNVKNGSFRFIDMQRSIADHYKYNFSLTWTAAALKQGKKVLIGGGNADQLITDLKERYGITVQKNDHNGTVSLSLKH